jgi:hypothetical protein
VHARPRAQIVRNSLDRPHGFALASSESQKGKLKSAKSSHGAMEAGRHTSFIFAAETEEERREWMRALRDKSVSSRFTSFQRSQRTKTHSKEGLKEASIGSVGSLPSATTDPASPPRANSALNTLRSVPESTDAASAPAADEIDISLGDGALETVVDGPESPSARASVSEA